MKEHIYFKQANFINDFKFIGVEIMLFHVYFYKVIQLYYHLDQELIWLLTYIQAGTVKLSQSWSGIIVNPN
jgi:hypothetical protein